VARPKAEQLELALGPYDNRKLFSDHFLEDRLPSWPEFTALEPQRLLGDLATLLDQERSGLPSANEAQTEERFIKPILERLGFAFTVQAGVATAGGRRQPDYALFDDDDDRAAAAQRSGAERFHRAVAVCDAKRFDRPLDKRGKEGALSEDPVAQIIHYIAITRTRWGVLTNGRLWRLYAAEGDMVEGACLEVDLVALLEAGDVEAFRYFALLFDAGAFAPGADGRSLLDRVLAGSRAQSVAVGERLRQQVFSAVPLIAEGLLGADARSAENLKTAFDHSLVVLYRLLFCLHAEDRGLLPLESVHYRSYSLREQRAEVARDRDAGRVFSIRSDDLYNALRALFRIVDRGEPALGVNEYDGGLFAAGAHPWLQGRSVPDHRMSLALDLLFRVGGEQVDYELAYIPVRHAHQILQGHATKVPGQIRRAATTAGLDPPARAGADRCAAYLINKRSSLDYPTVLHKGWPIATGVIEGACRHLVKDRMDITGARWGLHGAESILKLRAIRSNGAFEEYWRYHLAQEHHRVHASRYADNVVARPA
jgi:hypothetical protein